MKKLSEHWLILVSGVVLGIAALLLQALGNPANMGFCIACFERDIAGALGLHAAAKVQYLRPEIIGLVLGAFIMALVSGEFRAHAGSSPVVRFVLGAAVMIGALVFLGCPLRMLLRMGGGDLNAYVGLVGFVVGVFVGTLFIKRGFDLGRSTAVPKSEGTALPVIMAILLILAVAAPTIFKVSTEGPGSKHAPIAVSLIAALIVGALAYKSRLCMAGGVRDVFLMGDAHLLIGGAAVFVTVLLGNLILGKFSGFSALSQPIAHSNTLWNFLGMVVVGWGSVLLGGCPLRQLILAGGGNGDSAITVLGMIVGAAISHNFALAGNADGGVNEAGEYVRGALSGNAKLVVIALLVVLLVISLVNSAKKKEA